MQRVTSALILGFAVAASGLAEPADRFRGEQQVAILVDETVHPALAARLERYMDHVQQMADVEFDVLVEDFYHMPPPQIRDLLRSRYERSGGQMTGAIMVGPIPYAVRGKPEPYTYYYLTPAPLYYEDFDAAWHDRDQDGYFESHDYDRINNPTEIWTAWWLPPANDHSYQVELLQAYLDKLDRYYRGEVVGEGGMVFIAGNGNSVEITESWTVLMNDAMKSTDQQVQKVYSRHGEMSFAVHPEGEEFKPDDLENALEEGRYQHIHILTHGAPDGFYWEQAAIRGTRLDFNQFDQTGANIITTSGCSNGNFRGANRGATDYSTSIGNLLVFSPNTITVAFYGATSPQSTGVFAPMHVELYEFLDPQAGSGIGEGYYKLRNADYSWGTQHYFFRGGDGKALFGDPFAGYRKSRGAVPPSAATRPISVAEPTCP